MGSGISRTNVPILECPQGFDPQKFQKICTLFDKLDKDSNLGVTSDELTQIATLHVQNCQAQLAKRLEAEKQALARQFVDIEEKCLQDIDSIRREAVSAKEAARQQSKFAQANMESKIAKYKELDEDARENVFMKVLMPQNESHIDFWTFFEYMKTRTADIENIEE